MALTVPFADTDDLEARWRPLAEAEATRATTLLGDASQQILDEDRYGVLADLTEPTLTLIKITCAMVIRAMASGIEASSPPLTQHGWTSGGFNEQKTFANPTGDLYLTKAERRQLGFSRQRAGGVDMWAGSDQYATEA